MKTNNLKFHNFHSVLRARNLFITLFLTILFSCSLTAQQLDDQDFENPSDTLTEKINVGIMPVLNEGDDYDWVSFGIEYILSEKLSKLSSLYLPNKAIILNALKKRGLSINNINGNAIYKVGRETHIDMALAGDYKTNGEYIQLNIRFVNAFSGATVSTKTYTNKLINLFDITSDIINNLVNVTLISVNPEEKDILKRPMTKSVKALENFCLGYLENEKPGAENSKVINYFKKAIESDNDFLEARFNLGISYYNEQQYTEALVQFDKTISVLPNFEKPYFGRGLIYFKKNQYEKASADFEKVIELNPNDYLGYYYLGKIELNLNQFKKSQKYLNKSREINPDNPETYYELGNTYFNQNQFAAAISRYKKCIELKSDHLDARQKLGECFYRTQVYYRALLEFESILAIDPYDANAYFMIGTTVYKQAVLNDLIDAIFEIFDPYETGTKKIKKTEGNQQLKDELYRKMADSFFKAQQLRENFIQATFNLALTYKEMAEYDQSIEYFKKTIQIDPLLIRAHIQMAHTYELMNDKQAALRQYKEVIDIDPSYFVAHPTLGPTHQYINIVDVYLEELSNTLKEKPNDIKANQTMAKIFYDQGYHGKAANICRKILEFDSSNLVAKDILQKIDKK